MPKRTVFQRERDLLQISEMYFRGDIQAVIAEEIGQSQQTISNDIAELQKRWREQSLRNLTDLKAEQLAKIDLLERTYWDAWERSMLNAEMQIQKQKGRIIDDKKREIVPVEATKKVEGQVGNPAFLRGVLSCIEKRCELLGLDAPDLVGVFTFDYDEWEKIVEKRRERARQVLDAHFETE